VVEFYSATEGNCLTLNLSDVPGSCGSLLRGMAIVRWDEESQSVVRDARGFLQRTKPGEPGLLLCKITRGHRFDGYTDRSASERKIVRDAFKRGDAWFDTGDLLRLDAKRRLYFVDRLGDTFRWKGENVATCEVEEQLARWAPVEQASVYGVRIPGTEGRAGMATLVLRNGAPFDSAAFGHHVRGSLASYARPIVVRIAPQLQTTGTLKVTKTELQKQGFDPHVIADPLYLWNAEQDGYVPLGADEYHAIAGGRLRC
jgi:acyl-CoA synthetase (AMP-forming)/AMP-acid ligase II